MKKLNEYKVNPELSPEAWEFIKNYTGGEVPPKLRAEMIKYVQDMQPIIDKSHADMLADFDRILNQ